MAVRIGLLVVLGCATLPAALRSGQFMLAAIAGATAGTALAIWAARQTRFEVRDGHWYYIPHTVTGVAVSLLFVGRLVYRFVVLYGANRSAEGDVETLQAFGPPNLLTSPITVGLLGVVIAYYVCYYGVLLWKRNRISREDLEVEPTPIAASGGDYGGSSPG